MDRVFYYFKYALVIWLGAKSCLVIFKHAGTSGKLVACDKMAANIKHHFILIIIVKECPPFVRGQVILFGSPENWPVIGGMFI